MDVRTLLLVLFSGTLAASVHADQFSLLRSSVAPTGDVNGDGVPDFAIAQRGPGWRGGAKLGPEPVLERVWILCGADGSLIRTLQPPRCCEDFGRALADVGDVNGDGVRDLAVAGGGEVWVFSGSDGSVLHALAGESWGSGFGRSLAGGLDADGDGAPDVVVYRPVRSWIAAESAVVLLYSGRTGRLIRVLGCAAKSSMEGNDASELYAQVPGLALTGAIALVPDRDDDGRAELALTITDVRSGKPGEPGEALLILNPSDLTLHQRSPIPLSGAMGPAWEVRDLGDVTGDGVSDTIVTVINYCAFLFSGATGEEFRRHPWWDGYMYSEGSSLDVFDLDGDGISEYLIGANEDDMDCDRGYARVFSGADGTLLRNLSFDYRRDFDTCSVGVDTCAIGDVDGDGWVDVVVHMPRLEEARVLSGADFSTLVSVKIPAPGPK